MAATILPLLGTAVSAAGTIAGGAAARSQAQAQAQMNMFRAKQAEIAAAEARATGQRKAMDKGREGRLLASNRQAVAAASGGGATSPSEIRLGETIAGRTALQAGLEMYGGESRARDLENQADLSRMAAAADLQRGEAQQTSSYFGAGSTLLGGLGSAFRDWNKMPAAPTGSV